MRYIGSEISFIDKNNILSPSLGSEKFINDAIIEIFSRIRVLLYETLSDAEIKMIKSICEELGYTEQNAMKKLVYNTSEEKMSVSKYLEKILWWLRSFLSRYNISLDMIFISTVTQFAEYSKQPPRGYIPINLFEKKSYNDSKNLNICENIPKSIIGLCVDYLTRFMVDKKKEKAFEISLKGLSLMPNDVRMEIGFYESAEDVLKDINGLDDNSIRRACLLCCFDQCYRVGISYYKGFNIRMVLPDVNTINNIRIMVERACSFIKSYGAIVKYGYTFDGGYSNKIQQGDGDYLTEDTLWDMKVSRKSINIIWTLQVALYWILGKHSQQDCYKSISKIGIFNPRENVAYIAKTKAIPTDIIKNIEDDVIGYERNISYDEDSVNYGNRRAEVIKAKIKALSDLNLIKKDRQAFETKGREILNHITKK